MAVTDSDAPAARRPEMNEAVDLEEFCEQQEAQVAQQRPAGRSMKVAAVLLACMVGVALVAISGVDATARPQQETELLSKADEKSITQTQKRSYRRQAGQEGPFLLSGQGTKVRC